MKIKVEVTEILQRIIEVEANDLKDAIDKVEEMYRNEDIVLDYSDYISTEIKVVE